jgi:DNA-binding SARP family transcriptional activator
MRSCGSTLMEGLGNDERLQTLLLTSSCMISDFLADREHIMSQLRLAVFGPPEVFHDESRLTFSLRKAQALLLYLAVEKGMHPRSKLAALLWPDSETSTARTALSNAIALLRSKLADTSSTEPSHLLSQIDLLGLNPQATLWLDLDVVQQAYQQAQQISTLPLEYEGRASLIDNVQHALSHVRGPFLEGFWLREETPFDGWVQQQWQQWQVRLHLLCDRLSGWLEASGELEQAQTTLLRWLALDPLSEEAYRRLMRVHLALGDVTSALQVYDTCRTRLGQELQIEPSADTIALATHIRARMTYHSANPQAHPVLVQNRALSELIAPLIGRKASFTQLIGHLQQVWQGQPQAVFLMGEAGIGKTRLASDFVAWARAQGTEVLSGHALELGERLPYQPLVEALRSRMEEENAPEDLLDDLWLAELSRLLPELRERYPDLPVPTQDDLTVNLRLFEAVARLLDALSKRTPLVLLLDDLHWVDGASLDLVRYLGHYWQSHGSRVLLLGIVRCEGLSFDLTFTARLLDLRRDLPITQITLQPLKQRESLQLVEAIVEQQQCELGSGGLTIPASKTPVDVLGDFLFAQTRGQPFYLLEMLKLLREKELLISRMGTNGTWRLEPIREIGEAIRQEQFRRELVPPLVRAMIQARMAKLSQSAHLLVMACAVLGSRVSARLLWHVAELGVQAGIEGLEEAVKSGMLREEATGGQLGSYSFSYELMRKVVYTELGAARRYVLHQRVLTRLYVEGLETVEQVAQATSA